ncbi:uncharacterized protein GGS22DRAFT_198124 [Annulohypoxylon maeteangense]|uniref:uncharacterized protein n=1 Tax=Annulohypoxylon maeteangense TaxID=1927788 RepID=UPI002008743A|nr:uncharacterized protein GGS22DRAFT_198124 [Annulohypoxylon maeteangense]KAI0888350.1 hypothetical protein GGS22DRAFT_198124 [Annulohypoxylon maeteangense]
MSHENSSCHTAEIEATNEPTITKSPTTSSQVEFLRPLQDSQDSSGIASTRDSVIGKSCQDTHSALPTGVNLFTRPAIETAEEIGAGFQYQPPPGRIVPQNPRKTQKVPTASVLPTINKPSEKVSNSRRLEFVDPDKRQRDPPLNHDVENIGKYVASPPATSSGIDTVNTARVSRVVPDIEVSHTQAPILDVSDPAREENTYNFPFPDENSDGADLLHSDGRKHRSSYSPLSKSQLPKSISDTRRKALATMSPRNRLLRRKLSVSSSTSSERQLAQAAKASVERSHPGNKHRPKIPKTTSTSIETREDAHTSDAECPTKKHRTDGRQKRKDLTRPVLLESPQYDHMSTTRPCSQASNISKPRALLKMHHQQRTPSREQNSLNLIKFAKSWNTNYLYNQRLLDRWEQKMVMLEDHISSQDSIIEQYQQDIEFRDRTIKDLSAREEDLNAQNQKIQDEITTSSSARKKLEEKLRACRNRLNDAINEQQQLFLRCKENCEKATAALRTEGHFQKETMEKATAAIESVRADIKQKVATVIDDTNGQVENLNKTIESLETQLIEREKEIERERQHGLDLNNQLTEFRKLNEQTIQSVATQNLELLEKMKSDRERCENRDTLVQKQDEKIDTILKVLEETKLKTADPKALVERLEGLHNTTVEKIVVGVRNSMDSYRDSIITDQGTLNENLGEIHLLCEGICERMTDANNVAEWQGRAHDADMAIHTHLQNIQELQDEVHQMYIRSNEELEERERLKSQVTALQNAADKERVASEKARSLAEEVEWLRGALDERDGTITKSGEDLKSAQEELKAQARILQGKEQQIQNENEQHQRIIEQNVEKHNQVISETTREFGKKCQATEKRLQEAVVAHAQLEQELAELRQEAEISSQANIDEDLDKIRGELVGLITSMTGLTTGLQESEHEREALRRILEKWSRDRGEVGQMKNLLGRLAKDQPNTTKIGEQLKELLEIQKRVSGTLEYHQEGLANSEVMAGCSEDKQNGMSIHGEDGFSVVNRLESNVVHAQEELQSLKRKVVVKSPANDDNPALPMSVEEERSTRRQLLPPRGIMKMTTRSTSREQEAEGSTLTTDSQKAMAPQPSTNRRIAKRGSKPFLTTHSLYNRPVSGSISGLGGKQIDASQASHNEYRDDDDIDNNESLIRDFSKIVELGSVDEPPMKRHRTNDGQIIQNVKISRSMSTQFSAKSDDLGPKKMPPVPKTLTLRGGPIERRQSGLLTYGTL